MMATVHPTTSSLLPLLESLEDSSAGQAEQTDAYLTIANRLSGEDGKHFLPAVVKHFSRLGKVFQTHIASPNVELSQAALQALGFCVFNNSVVSGIPANFAEEILVALNTLAVKSTDKNTCTRALWVISKQNFPPDVVSKKVPDILKTLETVRAREDLQSVVIEHEALNVVIRLLEQTPSQMGEGAVQWVKLVIPLVVHSASKVRLRAAAALEMGLPLLLQKQQDVAAVIEPLMSSKLIPELQKLFSTKNESNVLKLWPLFVRLLGKLLHRGGPFINSLLHLEELGFRSSSPIIKKIAFIAWKSLIDNFALNPEILCSAKRLKLLMQPLSSIQVRTEALLLTKLEVWWYLVVKLGPNLAANFDQVGVPLLQSAVCTDLSHQSLATPSRNSSQNTSLGPSTPKTGGHAFNSPAATPRMSLNSSVSAQPGFPSIQMLGLEMLLHYLLGPDIAAAAAKGNLQLSLEPLVNPLLTSPSSFSKHASVLISAVRDGFIGIGKDAPDALLTLIWKTLLGYVTSAIETTGSKKDRPGSEVLTLLLQALQSIVSSETLPAQRTLGLLEATVNGIPCKILGSAAYQVANMDVLNGTPALFLILLFHHSSVLPSFVAEERFFLCLEMLVGCGLSGPTSPLAFSESVLGVMSRNGEAIQNKEHLWRMWSIVVNRLTDTITQTNEVNQGDALEHNFTAVHCALMFPVTHLLIGHTLPQLTQKSLLSTWSRLYKAFARCSALVATAEENVCCEELCGKMASALNAQALSSPSLLEAVASILLVIIECADFSPYTPQFQKKTKSPHTPLSWMRKKNKALGNLTTFQALLVQILESFLSQDTPETSAEGSGVAMGSLGTALITILSTLFSGLALGTAVQGVLASLCAPLATLYEHAGRPQNEQPKYFTSLGPKLEKLLGEMLGCLQNRSSLAYDDELLALLSPLLCVLFPHKSKQIRTLVTQFWNATFANTPVLIYPEDLKPVLSQVKQKTPIILPGFQAVDVPDDYSGQYSIESSQLETNISGVKIVSVGKRDSLLSRAGELRERSSDTPSKPVSVKLDFGSPKPRRDLLEEEASVDFVFIPPETKERVLTEHQKEVKRTKRVDIPAMYNNLDASLDTTVFTQYTQSQEDLVEKLPADGEVAETSKDEDKVKVQEVEMEIEEAPEPQMKPAQEDMDISSEVDPAGKGASKQEKPAEELAPKSADLLTTKDNGPGEDVAKETSETSSDDCNISASSDVVSGTPQKNSRRQSFITLEKYEEGKPASPIRVTKFTGPLTKPSSSQESAHSQQKDTSSQVSSEAKADLKTMHEPGHSRNHSQQQETSQKEAKDLVEGGKMEQPHPEEEESEKRRSRGSDYEDDIIPDTQTQVAAAEFIQQEPGQTKGAVEDASPTVDKDDSANSKDDSSLDDDFVDDSQVSSSQSEIRRSGRRRSRPLRPGEEREEVEERHAKQRRRSSLKEDSQVSLPDSQTDSQSQGRPSRRSKVLAEAPEVEVKDRLRRTRSDSQTTSPSPAVQNDSQSLGRVTRRSKAPGTTEEEINQNKSTPTSQNDSQSQGRPSRRSKMSSSTDEANRSDSQMLSSTHASQTDSQTQGRSGRRGKSAGLTDEEMSRSDSQSGLSASLNDSQSHGRPSRRSKAATPLEEMSQTDSQPTLSTPVSQTDSHSQGRSSRRSKVAASVEEMGQPDLRTSMSSPVSQIDSQPQGRSGRRSKGTASAEEMSQTDSQPALSISISQTDSQSEGRISRRSKVAATAEESNQTDSQTSLPTLVSQTDSQSQGRPGRRNKVTAPVEEMSQTYSQPALLTPASQAVSQSQDRLETSSKMIAELNVGPCPAPTAQTECSQVADDSEGTQESSQGLGRYKTRGSSQSLLSGTETPESDSSAIHGDSLVSRNRRRRSKLLKSEVASQSSQTNEVPEDSQRTETMETSPEVEMENSEVHQNLEPVIITQAETVEPLQNMETNNLPELIAPHSVEKTLEAKMEVVQTITEAHENVPSEKVEGETTKPMEEPSTELKKVDSQQVHRCPHTKRGRGRRRSRGCNCRAATMSKENDFQSQENDILSQDALSQEDDTLSQECGITESQGLEDPVESRVSADPSEPHSNSESTPPQPEEVLPQQEQLDAEANDDVFLEGNTLNTPTIPENSLTAMPSETEETTFDTTTEETWNTCESADDSGMETTEQTEAIKEAKPEILDKDSAREQNGEETTNVDKNSLVQEHTMVKEIIEDEEAMEKNEDTQIDNIAPITVPEDIAVQPLPEEPPVPQQVAAETLCLDSPPKQKHLEAVVGELELGQSPSSGKMRGVWSPSASPSTSILKKGQKRPLEIESPSPVQKSRRVSFADPIHHQELADDIDRRSPVIRTSSGSSPRSKNMNTIPLQQKFITTPTKGLLTLSPRNLRSPGYKSSKKCLISEMSQEPKPIPKDCVYPALVSCSTPVEAVLPQITSNMWPRGFGQLVRARNIRTVGDLSALTPTEIKSLPIRSPKLSNVKKALKNYHEQQRKGRSDELKGFDEMEKMTSEPDESELAQNQEDKPQGEQVADAELPDVSPRPPVEQRPAELLSEVEALGARMTSEELGHCSPSQLVLMHEQLGGMMRTIVVQLQARLAPSPGESIP